MSLTRSLSYWITSPGRGELRRDPLPVGRAPTLEAVFSAISCGTERVVGTAGVPPEAYQRMACRGMEGTFSLPLKYGYSWVGHRPDGTPAFAMHPHQDRIAIGLEETLSLPEGVPLDRATLVPNLETALNAWWDAEIQPGEPYLVVGGGVIGLLIAFVAERETGHPTRVIETDPVRRERIADIPWVQALTQTDIETSGAKVIFHTSGSGEGLQWAVDHLDFEGRVIELSWYGARVVSLKLGASFHYDRKRIIASQVATVAPAHRSPEGPTRRMQRVLALLADNRLDRILGPYIPFHTLPAAMKRLYDGEHLGLHPVVTYSSKK